MTEQNTAGDRASSVDMDQKMADLDAEIKEKLRSLEDGPSEEEIEEKSVSELLYPEGRLTPADSGWEHDPQEGIVRINPVHGFTRTVDEDTFFEANPQPKAK